MRKRGQGAKGNRELRKRERREREREWGGLPETWVTRCGEREREREGELHWTSLNCLRAGLLPIEGESHKCVSERKSEG